MRTLAMCLFGALVVLVTCGSAMALPPEVPEVDPGMAAGAFTVLGGGLLILASRKSK